jgi:hypothetical protein
MKFAMIRTGNVVTANMPRMHYLAYKQALELAAGAEVGRTAKGKLKITFDSAEAAEEFVTKWTAEYNAHRKNK